jgi:hypothetical protein
MPMSVLMRCGAFMPNFPYARAVRERLEAADEPLTL